MIEFLNATREPVMILCGIALGLCAMWLSVNALYGESKEKARWRKYSRMMWKKRHEADRKAAKKCR